MIHNKAHELPNSPFFSELLRHAHFLDQPAIRDLNQDGLTTTYAELLSDALNIRNLLRSSLARELISRIHADEEEICIGVLAAGGYEYVVAVLAVLALGAAVVPMAVVLPVQEATYFVKKSKQIAILTSDSANELGTSIASAVNRDGAPFDSNHNVQSIPVMSNLSRSATIPPSSVSICADRYLSDNQAGVVIFSMSAIGFDNISTC